MNLSVAGDINLKETPVLRLLASSRFRILLAFLQDSLTD